MILALLIVMGIIRVLAVRYSPKDVLGIYATGDVHSVQKEID
jgi:hypothetical protein